MMIDVLKLEFSSVITVTEAWRSEAHERQWY